MYQMCYGLEELIEEFPFTLYDTHNRQNGLFFSFSFFICDDVLITKSLGSTIRFMDIMVEKKIPISRVEADIKELWSILFNSPLPFAMHLLKKAEKRRGFWCIQYGPLGTHLMPTTEPELRQSIQQLLRCLMFLHGHGWVHRDIRWPNVVCDVNKVFYLIDFDLAAKAGTSIASHSASVPPDAVLTPWEPRHDIWQVGNLMSSTKMVLSDEAKEFVNLLQSGKLTAQDALKQVWIQKVLDQETLS